MSRDNPPFLLSFPIARAVAAQLFGGVVTIIAMALLRQAGWPAPPATLCIIWGCAAALATLPMRLARWWLPVQAAAPVLLWVALGLQPPTWVFPVVFVVLLALYWNAVGEGVPLYLTNATTWRAVEHLLPKGENIRMADLGSGLGGTLWHVAQARPDARFDGYETAPLVYAISRLRLLVQPRGNLTLHFKSLWRADLSGVDMVYCFLSPVPMERLYDKAKTEMKPGSLFVSNSFEVPGVTADQIVEVDDRRQTRLLVYRM